jgi:hypothetical protein
MNARGADGAVNTKPIEEWAGVSAGGGWNPLNWLRAGDPRVQAAGALDALNTKDPKAVEAAGANWMRNQGGARHMVQSWDPSKKVDGSWGGAFSEGDGMQTYLPIGAGLLGMIGGAATNNPWISILGALAAAYGGYKMYNNYKTVNDPKMWEGANKNIAVPDTAPMTGRGSALDAAGQQRLLEANRTFRQAEAERETKFRAPLRKAQATFAPIQGLTGAPAVPPPAPKPGPSTSKVVAPPQPTKPTPVPPTPAEPVMAAATKPPDVPGMTKLSWGMADVPDRADLAGTVQSHIDLARMKQDIVNDRQLDPIQAGTMLRGIEFAENKIKSQQASVGMFGLGAAPVLGLAAAITLGALYATTPQTQASMAQFGGGVVSGAQALGVL